jgi:hypothetical protein
MTCLEGSSVLCRPLTPGLTSIDWEEMLQAAVGQSQPPPDLVLHECL